jgi:hypothetical protein
MPSIKITEVQKTYTIIPEGKYEVVVDGFDDVETIDGIETSRIAFVIRKDTSDDLSTANGGRKIFSNIKNASNFVWLISGLSKALGIPVHTEYDDLSDFLNAIKGRSLVVKVKHRPNAKDASKPYVNATDFYPTTAGEVTLESSTDDNAII